MIPEFPDFKNFELSDKEEVEKNFTNKFSPHSDFNFTSLWLWDIDGKMMLSQLNGNLVVFFQDYVSNNPFLSFIGNNLVEETAATLLEYSKKSHNVEYLKFVPEEIAKSLPSDKFVVTPDKDSYDYIYHIPDLANMNILRDNSFGKNIRKFVETHPDYAVKEYFIHTAPQEECENLFGRWASNKNIENYFEINEFRAFKRLFQISADNIRIICLYMDKTLVGFTVYEMLPNNFVMSHFAKADKNYHKSINDILNWEEARNLTAKGMKHFNWEQDLGIPGLRQSKEKYNPCFFLEKFIIVFANK